MILISLFVAMKKYDMSRDPGNENHVRILIKLGTHSNKKFSSNISLHHKGTCGLHYKERIEKVKKVYKKEEVFSSQNNLFCTKMIYNLFKNN